MSNVKNRLDEAEFFLKKLKRFRNKQPDFNYYINAYITSSRSVLWIMVAEYTHVKGWKEWYDKKAPDSQVEGILSGIVDLRNRSQKQRPIKVNRSLIFENNGQTVNMAEELGFLINKKLNITIEECSKEELKDKPVVNKSDNEVRFFGRVHEAPTVEEFNTRDIISVCNDYFIWLRDIVTECINLFGSVD
jgi:hypothetical protein